MFLFFVLFGGGKMSAFNRCIISGLIDSEPNFNPDGELIFSIIINRKDIPRKEKIHVTIKNKGLYKKAFKEIKKVPKVELLIPYVFKKGLNWSYRLC